MGIHAVLEPDGPQTYKASPLLPQLLLLLLPVQLYRLPWMQAVLVVVGAAVPTVQ